MHNNLYCNALLSAASSYDAQFAPKGRADCTTAKAPRRNVYAHDLADYGDDDINDTYNLDSDIVDLLANVHKHHPKDPTFNRNGISHTSTCNRNGTFPKPHLTSQQWHSLQPDAQATWNLLSDEAKAIILGLCKDLGKHSVILHNISAFDFLQTNMHGIQLDDIEDTDNTLPDPDDDHGEAAAQVDEDNST